MKIAVVGAGLAGLSAAWWLGRRHEVTLFERQSGPGFTAASVSVPGPPGQPVQRVDVPLRVFYPGYYPTLGSLYRDLGVATEPVSYAASLLDAQGRLVFRYRNLRWAGRSVGLVAPQDLCLGPRAWRVAAGALRFRLAATAALRRGALAGLSIGEHVAAAGYPADFVDTLLLPAIATVATCSLAQARDMPAEVVVNYLARGLASQPVHRALQGADEVQRRLLAGIPRLRSPAPLDGLRRTPDGVLLLLSSGSQEVFDHVVLATQANQARALLHDASAEEAAMLAGFAYTPVEVLTHRDPRLMPARRRDWSPVNLRVDPAHPAPESTIWVNAVQPGLRGAPDVFQTVAPQREPAPGLLIGRARFERPLVDAGSPRGWARLDALHREHGRRLWFCGAYAQAGIPLLESAVRSAQGVAQRLLGPA